MNNELTSLYGEPKAGKIRWAAHVVRMPDNKAANLQFARDVDGTSRSEGHRQGGRTRGRKVRQMWNAAEDAGLQPLAESCGEEWFI